MASLWFFVLLLWTYSLKNISCGSFIYLRDIKVSWKELFEMIFELMTSLNSDQLPIITYNFYTLSCNFGRSKKNCKIRMTIYIKIEKYLEPHFWHKISQILALGLDNNLHPLWLRLRPLEQRSKPSNAWQWVFIEHSGGASTRRSVCWLRLNFQ